MAMLRHTPEQELNIALDAEILHMAILSEQRAVTQTELTIGKAVTTSPVVLRYLRYLDMKVPLRLQP